MRLGASALPRRLQWGGAPQAENVALRRLSSSVPDRIPKAGQRRQGVAGTRRSEEHERHRGSHARAPPAAAPPRLENLPDEKVVSAIVDAARAPLGSPQ